MFDIKNIPSIIKREVKLAFVNNKYIILFAVLIFLIPTVMAYFHPNIFASYLQPLIDSFTKNINDGTVVLTTQSLFINNLKAVIAMYVGSLFFAVVGILILVNNGLFIGYYGSQTLLIAYLALILPHGIFEIPAIILSCSGGLVFFSFILHFIWNVFKVDYSYTDIFDPYYSKEKISIFGRIKSSLNKHKSKIKESFILLCASIILLLIAAFIEANITIPLARLFLALFGISF